MNKPFIKQEKIRFKHVDFAGIVFYPRFLEMLNDLVEDFFEEVLDTPFSTLHDNINGESFGIPTVDLKVQFKSPGRIGDVLSKKLWVIQLKTSSLLCGFQFLNQHDKTVLEGEVILVNVKIQKDKNEIKSESFNDAMKIKIMNYKL